MNEIHEKVLEDLVLYIDRVGKKEHVISESQYGSITSKDIPTACLVTGVNLPDHDSLFSSLTSTLKDKVSPYVARLLSTKCSNIK